MFGKRIEVIKRIDLSGQGLSRYNDAVLVKVHNGKGALSFEGKMSPDYTYQKQLMLNGQPLMQGEYPECPTCSSVLARGYGIENIHCPELKAVRDRINGKFTGLDDAVSALTPLLGLLDSGYYIIADCPQYPTYGDTSFFMNVPDKMTHISASCSDYYLSGMMTTADGTPAYLYPSQSNSCINEDRVDYYRDIIALPDAPRAVALYDYGFVSVLLDGHHKAAAAAKEGVSVPCIVIIPTQGETYSIEPGTKIKTDRRYRFADIDIPAEEIDNLPYRSKNTFAGIQSFGRNIPVSEAGMKLYRYPMIDEFAALAVYSLETKPSDITDEQISKWMASDDYDDQYALHIALTYLSRCDCERACRYAKNIMRSRRCDIVAMTTAIRVLLSCRDAETEQLFIDYLVDADKHSAGYEMVLSYF